MRRLLLAVGVLVWLAACTDETPKPKPEPESSPVQPAEIQKSESAPPVAAKKLPDMGKMSINAADPYATAVSELKSYPIAYETPSEGKIGEAFEVVLAIDATGDDSAIEGLPGQNIIVESQAKLSKTVEATLSGAAFDIKLMNKDRQRLSPYAESTWRWSVTPKQAGSHTLYLEIHAVVGEGESMLLQSFADEISVSVSHQGAFFGISADTLRTYIGIVGGTISAIVGLIALIGFIRRKPQKEKGGDKAGYVDSDKTSGLE